MEISNLPDKEFKVDSQLRRRIDEHGEKFNKEKI